MNPIYEASKVDLSAFLKALDAAGFKEHADEHAIPGYPRKMFKWDGPISAYFYVYDDGKIGWMAGSVTPRVGVDFLTKLWPKLITLPLGEFSVNVRIGSLMLLLPIWEEVEAKAKLLSDYGEVSLESLYDRNVRNVLPDLSVRVTEWSDRVDGWSKQFAIPLNTPSPIFIKTGMHSGRRIPYTLGPLRDLLTWYQVTPEKDLANAASGYGSEKLEELFREWAKTSPDKPADDDALDLTEASKKPVAETFSWHLNRKDFARAEALVPKLPDLNAYNQWGMRLLGYACSVGAVGVVRAMLAAGADPHVTESSNQWGMSDALCKALHSGHVGCVEALIPTVKDVNTPKWGFQKESYLWDTLAYTSTPGVLDCVAELCKVPGIQVDVTDPDRDGLTPLEYLFSQYWYARRNEPHLTSGYVNAVAALRISGAKVSFRVLREIEQLPEEDPVRKAIIGSGPDILSDDDALDLTEATLSDEERYEMRPEELQNVSFEDFKDPDSLALFAFENFRNGFHGSKVIEECVRWGASLTQTKPHSEDGDTLLHEAAYMGMLGVVRVITERRDFHNWDLLNNYRQTPLFLCCMGGPGGAAKIIQLLLDKGADPNARDKYDDTPLSHVDSMESDVALESVKILLAAGARPNDLIDDGKETVFAKLAGSALGADAIVYLLDHGANPFVLNADGEHVVDVLKKNWRGHPGERIVLDALGRLQAPDVISDDSHFDLTESL